jgi:hypothetical protein
MQRFFYQVLKDSTTEFDFTKNPFNSTVIKRVNNVRNNLMAIKEDPFS